jgi:hypothetical protein
VFVFPFKVRNHPFLLLLYLGLTIDYLTEHILSKTSQMISDSIPIELTRKPQLHGNKPNIFSFFDLYGKVKEPIASAESSRKIKVRKKNLHLFHM